MTAALPPFTPHFAALAANYDVVLSDVWGVLHNGVTAFPEPCNALMRAREGGATVILITNAPRPSDSVVRQLDRLKVPRETCDGIVSSGDVTRAVVQSRPDQSLFHLGPDRDRAIFTGLDVRFAPLETADYVICSGLLDDEVETPENYRAQLQAMHSRKLFMVCGNPDVVVERGPKLVYCAGALADLYAAMGGDVLYAGKPYLPIYQSALAKASAARGGKLVPSRVLAIGDSVRTDFKGAHAVGIDFMFVTAGIHAEELGGREQPATQALGEMFAAAGGMPKAVMRQLVW
jgi:HAD superfamily hydrolase (TIGR01459 family)